MKSYEDNYQELSDSQDENPDDENLQSYHISVNPDRDGFLRRSCPACSRDFKTVINPADLSSILTPEIERAGEALGIGLTGGEKKSEETRLNCPYCGHCAKASEMLHEDLAQYIRRFAIREVVLPMLEKAFGGMESRSSSRSFITFEFLLPTSPTRPIHGPEPADMKIINLLCCGERVKISETWNSMEKCPYCGEAVSIV